MGDFVAALLGAERAEAVKLIVDNHYTHMVPSGKSHYFCIGGAYVVFSIPANRNLKRFIIGDI
jgi:hypothetical protein